MQQLPNTTNKQLDILLHLYKFYFLHTNQFQTLFKHKKPQTVQTWLKDLKDKGYIAIHDFKENKFIAKTEPSVYYLTKLARQKLKDNDKCDRDILNRVYQTISLSSEFVRSRIFLADIYLNLVSQMKDTEKLHFSTKANLQGFDYFPNPLPDAFIAIKTSKKTKRSFLFLLNAKIPWKILDRRMNRYVEYTHDNQWGEYTKDPLPTFLIICPNETTKKHIYKTISDESPDTPFYLTTKETIQKSGFEGDVWEKVEPEEV